MEELECHGEHVLYYLVLDLVPKDVIVVGIVIGILRKYKGKILHNCSLCNKVNLQ